MISFLSLRCFVVFFSMELLIEFVKAFPLETGDQMGKSMYAMGSSSKCTCFELLLMHFVTIFQALTLLREGKHPQSV